MNTSEIPSGGWQFYQSQTGWHAPSPVGYTYDQQVTNIIKHRQANPAMINKHKLSLDPAVVGQELINFQIARGAIKAPPKITPPSILPQLSGAVQGAVAAVKKMASGAATLLEWEEAGMPHVEPAIASQRAETCSKCPKNDEGKSFTEYFTVPVARRFEEQFKRMDSENLKTPHDHLLKVCQACLCPMRSKVWFPNELVLKRLKPEQRAELNQNHPRCWILDLP